MPMLRNLALTALTTLLPLAAGAQLRPSIEAEVLTQWSNLDDSAVNPGWLHGAVLVSVPIVRGTQVSWVASGQLAGQLIGRGEDLDCAIPPGQSECLGHLDVSPRGALLTGVAYQGRSVLLRAQGGMANYRRERLGTKSGPQLRIDATLPARSNIGLTLSASHAWLGDFLGSKLGMTAVGIGVRVGP